MRKKDFKARAKTSRFDFGLVALIFLLVGFGVVMVYNASAAEAYRDFGDKYFYLKSQAIWALVGLGLMLIVSQIKYTFFKRLSLPFFITSLGALVLVLIIAPRVQGAKRWLSVGGWSFQPSELVKLASVVYLSSWLSVKARDLKQFLFLLALTCGLVVLQPDLGTSLVIAITAFSLYFISGISWLKFILISFTGVILAAGLVLTSAYRRQRLLSFLDPTSDPLGSSYHIRQALIALASGGLWGLGLGQSRQKYSYLPEVATDSIFAIMAEEAGFIGALIFIILIWLLIFKIFQLASRAPDAFSRFLVTGIGVWFGCQTWLNLGAMVALVPLTGIPLPLISYGGSSLVVNLLALGMVLNVAKYVKVK